MKLVARRLNLTDSDFPPKKVRKQFPPPKPERTLRGTELVETVARRIVGGSDREAVAAYVDHVRSQMNDAEEDNGDPIDDEVLQPLTAGRPLVTNVRPQTRTLRAFLTAFCSAERWGGALVAEQHSLRDVIQRFTPGGKAEPFDPYAPPEDHQSMVSLLDEHRFQLPATPVCAPLGILGRSPR